jgi:2-keto-4-pentenoate hydratase
MTPADFAIALHQARATCRRIDATEAFPANVADAYAVQENLASLAGGTVSGWKVTALNPRDQALYGTDRAVAGPLFSGSVLVSPAPVVLSHFIAPLLECEIAFVLAADLPPRRVPYSRDEVAKAIAHLVPAIEIPDCRLAGAPSPLAILADDMGNGAFLAGTPVANWHDLDLKKIDVVLEEDGGRIVRGRSTRIGIDPLMAVVELANAQPLPAGGLRRGQVITTGSCIDPIPARSGSWRGSFGPLGEISFACVA